MNVNELLDFRVELVNRHGEELAAVDKVLALMSVGMGQLPMAVARASDEVNGLKSKSKGKGGRPPGLTVEAAARAKRNGAREDARPPVAARPTGVGSDRQFAGGSGKLSDAIRAVCAKLPAGFSRLQVTEALGRGYDTAQVKTRTAATLLNLLETGELTRVGQGSEARYTVARLKGTSVPATAPAARKVGPSKKEKAYQQLRGEIQVPRDADVEAS